MNVKKSKLAPGDDAPETIGLVLAHGLVQCSKMAVGVINPWSFSALIFTLGAVAIFGPPKALTAILAIGQLVLALVSSTAPMVAGWALSALLLTIGTPAYIMCDRRLRAAGTKISKLKSQLDPQRSTSNDPKAILARNQRPVADKIKELDRAREAEDGINQCAGEEQSDD